MAAHISNKVRMSLNAARLADELFKTAAEIFHCIAPAKADLRGSVIRCLT